MDSKIIKTYINNNYPDVRICEIDWYTRCLRCISSNRNSLENIGSMILNIWENYNDADCDIISQTDKKHNTLAPIAYINDNNEYILDLVFRNNRQSKAFPEGIFHAHNEFHNIKKEAIGIVESMGRFILPGRLKNELQEAAKYLEGSKKLPIENNNILFKHQFMIEKLIKIHGNSLNEENSIKVLIEYINNACRSILENISVFKNNEIGNKCFAKFIDYMNLKEI